jgi:nitrate/TMAO reductase-like tetraheme cytochrome c subunit
LQRLNRSVVQEKSPWLALAFALIILISTVSLTLFRPSRIQASDPLLQPSLPFVSGDFTSPQQCRICHEAEFAAWSNTTHAEASFDPIFQVSLQKIAEPGECFSCHTTGYDSVTGRFVLAGVTCEACHGPYRPDHPQESMAVAASEELCGTCHKNTLAEWKSSHHSRAGVTCADCHEVHTQKTREAANANLLCARCHTEQTQDALHLAHEIDETGVFCIDCHLARQEVDADASGVTAGTGHAFTVVVSACSDCHPSALNVVTP